MHGSRGILKCDTEWLFQVFRAIFPWLYMASRGIWQCGVREMVDFEFSWDVIILCGTFCRSSTEWN